MSYQTCSNFESNITDDSNYDIIKVRSDASLFLEQRTEIVQGHEKANEDVGIIVEVELDNYLS